MFLIERLTKLKANSSHVRCRHTQQTVKPHSTYRQRWLYLAVGVGGQRLGGGCWSLFNRNQSEQRSAGFVCVDMFYFLSLGKLIVFTGLSRKVKGTVQIFDISRHWLDYGWMVWTLHEQCNATFHAVCRAHLSTQTSSYCWYKDVLHSCVLLLKQVNKHVFTDSTGLHKSISSVWELIRDPSQTRSRWSGHGTRTKCQTNDSSCVYHQVWSSGLMKTTNKTTDTDQAQLDQDNSQHTRTRGRRHKQQRHMNTDLQVWSVEVTCSGGFRAGSGGSGLVGGAGLSWTW